MDPCTSFSLVQLGGGQRSGQSVSNGPLGCNQNATVKLALLAGLATVADKSGTARVWRANYSLVAL